MFENITPHRSTPSFPMTLHDGRQIYFSDWKGSWVVLYFYPKDLTPGCTTEAIGFQALLPEFRKIPAYVVGVSRDTCQSHQKFMNKHHLEFSLVADESGELARFFDVLQERKMFGKTFLGVQRATFLINPDGLIVGTWKKVEVNTHPQEVLSQIKKML